MTVMECVVPLTTEKPVVDLPPLVVKEPSLTEQVTEAIEAVVARAGTDHVYKPHKDNNVSSALYVYNGVGDCLVGQVLTHMGVAPSVLKPLEGSTAEPVVTLVFGSRAGAFEVMEVARALREAQCYNDSQQPWGNALVAYKSALA